MATPTGKRFQVERLGRGMITYPLLMELMELYHKGRLMHSQPV